MAEVSICIPTYNGESVIEATLRSALNQTVRDLEVIIVDDCSHDRTVELVKKFADPRIALFVNPQNLGAARTWNRALEMAKGKFVKLLCHDDLLTPDCIERQAAIFQSGRHEDVELVACSRRFIDGEGKTLFTANPLGSREQKIAGDEAIQRIISTGTNLIGEPSAGLFRSSTFGRTTGFNEKYSYMIDIEFWTRLLSQGSLYYLPEPLCAFRIHKMSWSNRSAASQARESRAFTRELAKRSSRQIGTLEVLKGCVMGTLRAYLRRVFYIGLKILGRF